jgi:hypothetical protein
VALAVAVGSPAGAGVGAGATNAYAANPTISGTMVMMPTGRRRFRMFSFMQ